MQLISAAAVNELGQGVQFLSGAADLQVRGPRGGFDEAIYPQLARMPEVAIASPVVEVDARLADRNEALKIIGIDAFRAAGVQPGLIAATEQTGWISLRSDVLFLESRRGTLARRRCQDKREAAECVAQRFTCASPV